MADTQASAFGDIPVLDLTNDRIPILDVSATGNDKNKLISATTLMASKLDLAGGTVTGQLALNNASATGALNLAPTWNNVATAFNLIYARVTNTASASGSNLLDLGTVADGSLFKVEKDGSLVLISPSLGINGVALRPGSGGIYGVVQLNNGNVQIRSDISSNLTLGCAAVLLDSGSGAARLYVSSNNTLELVNGAAAQTFRVYGTTTGAKHSSITHDGTHGTLTTSAGKLILLGNDGVQLGGSPSSNIGFYGTTPGARPGVGVSPAAFVENSGGTAVNTDSTFGGYTIAQLAQTLQNLGLID